MKTWILFITLTLLVVLVIKVKPSRGGLFEGSKARTSVEWIEGKTEGKAKLGPGDYGRRFEVGGNSRFYEMHVPQALDRSRPAPLVLVFHGGGGDPGTIRYESGMDAVADKEGFLIAYPAGTPTKALLKERLLIWNDGRKMKDGSSSKVDDVAYVAALLDDLGKLCDIDPKRVYACGFSNGAQFTFRLAKRMSSRIAAIATVAGQRPAKDQFDPAPTRPMPLLQFAGLEDPVGPYHGGKPKSGTSVIEVDGFSIVETIDSWVDFNKCSTPPENKQVGQAVMKRHGSCADGAEVVLWTLEDGGHTWPGGKTFPGSEKIGLGTMGKINQDINASEVMWNFFRKHPRK